MFFAQRLSYKLQEQKMSQFSIGFVRNEQYTSKLFDNLGTFN